MDSRHSEPLRKRKHRLSSTLVTGVEEESWDCTVCTYKNSAEAFRCEMCQTRKGTSTRKPKLNRQIVEEQSLIARAIIKERQEEVGSGTGGSESTTPHRRKYHRHLNPNLTNSASAPSLKHGGLLRPGSLRNIDRSSSQQFEVFANGFSVIITEYYPKASSPSTHGGRKQTLSLPYSPTLPIPSLLVAPSSTPLGNGATKVEPDCHPAPPTTNHLSSPSSGGDAGGGHSNLASLNNFIAIPEEEEERKTQLHADTKDFSPDEGDPCAIDPISPSLIGQNPEVTATQLRSSISATSILVRKKRRKRRLQSELSANNPSRSLRSNTGSSAVTSRSRQASRIARASLYRATNTPRPYKRRKIATPSTTNVPVESASTSGMASPINRESTAPMTDSCGAMALEMSATGAST